MKTDQQTPESPESIIGVKTITRRRTAISGDMEKFISTVLLFDFTVRIRIENERFFLTRGGENLKTIELSWKFIEDARFTDVATSRRKGFEECASAVLADFVVMTFDMWPIEPAKMREMWRRFLVVRGFIDAFAPGNDTFDKEATKAFVIDGRRGLARQLQGMILAQGECARTEVDDRKPAGVVDEARIRRGDVIGFDVKDSAMPRTVVRVTSMKFIHSYRESGRILDLDVELAAR